MAEENKKQETVKEEEKEVKENNKSQKKENKENKSKKEIEELQEKLKAAEEKAAKDKDDYIRLYAEFDNYRRRTSQEKLDLVSSAASETIKGLLPVLDDCERAMKALADSEASEAAKEGTELIYNKLMSYLKGKGLAAIEAKNLPFDTDVHEAVTMFPVSDENMKGKVIDVIQTGYTLNGKVIRFAKVVVGQ